MSKMIVNRGNFKRKRKEDRSLILEDSPKRTKVHAQRKFAQGSNVNSPVITPVDELEKPEGSGISIIPDPTELLPIKRPNTEDFLTFLCFRGTPLLPPNLNFFNTASFVDTNGQVHEIKSESPKNGPIDTSIIAKTGCSSSDRPFIAFGVRKRADPVVISRQMDKKRRHALALQALRRKYQEQKMAKIRAVTISKLSEKITNKTLVRTNSVSKTDNVTKKSTVQKTKVIATKHVKVTRTVKTTLRPKIQPKMCLRSFRGRFVQKELPFRHKNVRKKPPPVRRIIKKVEEKKIVIKKNRRSLSSEFSSDDNEPLVTTTSKEVKRSPKVIISKLDHPKHMQTSSKETSQTSNRMTRSKHSKDGNFEQKRQQVKKRIFIPSSSTPIVKVRNLRSQTVLKSAPSAKKRVLLVKETVKTVRSPRSMKKFVPKASPNVKKPVSSSDRVLRSPRRINKRIEKTTKQITRREERITNIERPKLVRVKKLDKRMSNSDTEPKKTDKSKDKTHEDDVTDKKQNQSERLTKKSDNKSNEQSNKDRNEKDVAVKEQSNKDKKPTEKTVSSKEKQTEKPQNKTENKSKPVTQSKVLLKDTAVANKNNQKEEKEDTKNTPDKKIEVDNEKTDNIIKKPEKKVLKSKVEKTSNKSTISTKLGETNKNKGNTSCSSKTGIEAVRDVGEEKATKEFMKKEKVVKKDSQNKEERSEKSFIKKKETTEEKLEIPNKGITKEQSSNRTETSKSNEKLSSKTDRKDGKEKVTPKPVEKNTKKCGKKIILKTLGNNPQKKEISEATEKSEEEQKPSSTRPSRKTKEAAAIYMEILSHKLVNDSKIDDDNISIDSFPELPNVKKMEQRENEFRAKSSQKLVEEASSKSSKMKETKPKIVANEDHIASSDATAKPKNTAHKEDSERLVKKDGEEYQNIDKSSSLKSSVKPTQDKIKTVKQKELKVLVGNVNDKSKKNSGSGTKEKSAVIISSDFDEEKVKEEIMREVQQKLGTNIPLETKRPEKMHAKKVVATEPKQISSKRKSSLSDDEDLESIESIRKKLKSENKAQVHEKESKIKGENATKDNEDLQSIENIRKKLKSENEAQIQKKGSKNKDVAIKDTEDLQSIENIRTKLKSENETQDQKKGSKYKEVGASIKDNEDLESIENIRRKLKSEGEDQDQKKGSEYKVGTSIKDNEDLESIENVRRKLKSEGEDQFQKKGSNDEGEIATKDNPKVKPPLDATGIEAGSSNKMQQKMDKQKVETTISNQNKEKDNNSNSKTNSNLPATLKNANESDEKTNSKKVEKETNTTKVNTHNESTKRQTRQVNQNPKNRENGDSDESFRADVKIPRKKQVTRHKTPKQYKSFSDSEESFIWEENETTQKFLEKSVSSGESDHSTTSDHDKKPGSFTNKNKRYTKTKSKVTRDPNFSDSDEEPLVKLAQSKPPQEQNDNNDSSINDDIRDESAATNRKINIEVVVKKNTKTTEETKAESNSQPQEMVLEEDTKKSAKPKRECAKRPQNYLPMLSSSDDDDKFFYGFDVDSNKDSTFKPTIAAAALPTTVDLSSKDIGRRFGKGKVNMSTEQIEQWLKDSVLAGSSLKKENDEMLKFGEKIPTETSLELAPSIDTHQLKESLLPAEDKKEEVKIENKPKQSTLKLLSPSSEKVIKLSFSSKNQSLDKKLIFRKEKKNTTPNVNAFSASNESSVYAFGEENEDIISTPFRRPVRRPSSTATSKSEEEGGRNEDTLKPGHFRRPPLMKQDVKATIKDPLNEDTTSQENTLTSEENIIVDSSSEVDNKGPSNKIYRESKLAEEKPSCSMIPPSNMLQKSRSADYKLLKLASRSFDRTSENSEDGKYKIPSSPSASSSSSAKLYKRQAGKPKSRVQLEVCTPVTVPSFPSGSYTPMLVEAPTFYPVDKEFQDPLEYIEKIRHKAEEFGICRIVPPSSFKPECKVTDDMRFTAYNQYVHKMLHRWGPNFKEFMAIKKYLQTHNITFVHSPWIGGMEIDLPRLYQTVQSLGGLKEVIEKKKWPRVSELMKIPKSAQDRVTKLDDIYCKYLLPYDTLSPAEREKLFDEVETEWAKRESKTLSKLQQNASSQANAIDSDNESDHETEECIIKGRNMALNAFYRIARNTMSVWFKTSEPSAQEVEQEFWKHVTQRQNHICVHSGSIDSGSWGYGFAVSKNSPFARNAWNLKVLTNNSGSVLRSLGPIMGVTVPTLHVGMVFSACCWYRDPHSLPWIEYLHTGGNKIWYSIPDSASELFHSAMTKLVPNYCKNKTIWLASDTAMVPPSLLIENGVSLCRTVQEPGQFVVVFPKAFTSSISTGYLVSESVYFAPPYWLKTAQKVFNDMRMSCESSMFSLSRLLISIANDSRSSADVLRLILPLVKDMCDKEKTHRNKLKSLGLSLSEKLPPPEAPNVRKRKKLHGEEGDYECEICRMNLFISMVVDVQESGLYCIEHTIEFVENGKVQIANCKLLYTYDEEELNGLPDKINAAIENKMQKKVPNKFYGMPTLLKS